MRPYITRALMMATVCGGMLATFASRPVAAADDEQMAAQADHALNEALGKADKTAVGRFLDANFEWTDAEGKTRTKAETLQALPVLATDTRDQVEIQTHNFGQVVRFVGRHQSTRFVHLWVKRADGWRAFVFLDTPIPAEGYKNRPIPPQAEDKECINPCKVLPFKPANAAQQGAVDSWLATKIDEWHAIADDWPKHASDTNVAISPTMFMNKAERLALLVKQKEAYGDGSHSPAVESMQMYDFGNAVIMTSLHAPGANGKRARAVRLFVNEDGVWKIALSAQTDIQHPAS
ncbi:MAG: nuclear transport factor 2 family protein [Acidobacteriia bacterium]|nr:nuclear transport factor 2 family protein [Terriglobia bacterium]